MKHTEASTSVRRNPAADDAALLKRAKTGDNQALAALYEATCTDTWHTVKALVKNEDDAMDVLQDTYLKAFSKLNTLEKPESLRPWLRQIAANTAKTHLLRKRPTLFTELEQENDLPVDFADDRTGSLPEAAADRKETVRLVNEILDSLPDAQRLVIGLYYYQELPVKDIAQRLNVSQNTVKSQLRYGRQKIEQRVRALEKEGVNLLGAAPMVFFRTLLRDGLGKAPAPKAASQLTGALSARGVEALEVSGTVPVKAATAGSVWGKRLALGAAVLTAAGGIAMGAGLLRRHLRHREDVAPDLPTQEQLVWVTQAPTEHDPEAVSVPETEAHAAPDTEALTEPAGQDPDPFGGEENRRAWQEALLHVLAGTATAADDNNSLSWLDIFPHMLDDESVPTAARWFVADCDGDGVPELLRGQHNGSSADYALRYVPKGDRITVTSCSSFRHGSPDVRSTLLYTGEGYICYNKGTFTPSVENLNDEGDPIWVFSNSVIEGTGAPYEDMPDYGPLSRKEEAEYPADYETYIYSLYDDTASTYVFLEHMTLEDGTEYFLSYRRTPESNEPSRFLSEDEYRALEQELIDLAIRRCPDETHAPQLQHIPGEDGIGPMDIRELVEYLGGFDNRPEWSDAVRSLQPFGSRIAELLSDEAALTEALQGQFPLETMDEGSWSFAVTFCAEDPVLVLCCRQPQELGGACFLGSLRYRAGLNLEDLEFCRLSAEDADALYCSESGWLYVLRAGASDAGETPVLLECPSLEEASFGVNIQMAPVILRSGEELIARYTDDPMSETCDQGASVPLYELTETDNG